MSERKAQRIAITPTQAYGLRSQLSAPARAEDYGYTDAWFADTGYPDTLTLAATAGITTKTLRVGVAVNSVYARTPVTLASTAATLNKVLDGRFVLGIGSSSATMTEGWHGVSFEKPVTRVRETAQIIRQALSGEKTNFKGETVSSTGYRQPADGVPVFIAALRPKMIEVASSHGDGVVLNLWPARALPKIVEHIAIGAKAADKNANSVEVINRYQICVTDDVDAARDRFRAFFGGYYSTSVYNNYLRWSGFEGEANDIVEAWNKRDRAGVAASFTNELIDELALIGPVESIVERLKSFGEKGIDTRIVSIISGYSQQEYEQVLRDIAEVWHK
jgi:probable F420-dependent oxidoreductase